MNKKISITTRTHALNTHKTQEEVICRRRF